MIKKYNEMKNVSGKVIKEGREAIKMKKTELSNKLQLQGISINPDELRLMEKNKLMIKDFELVAMCKILNIDMNILKEFID